jgi:hypothetical protein
LESQKSTSSNCISLLKNIFINKNKNINYYQYSAELTRRGRAGELFDRLSDKSNKCGRNDDVSSSSSSIIISKKTKKKFFSI